MMEFDPASMVPARYDAPAETFDEASRYRGLPLLRWTDAGGREHVYVDRRPVPAREDLVAIGQVEVGDGDRIENIAAEQFGDARLWWRIADANRALDPMELTAPHNIGRRLLVTLPPGMPAPRR